MANIGSMPLDDLEPADAPFQSLPEAQIPGGNTAANRNLFHHIAVHLREAYPSEPIAPDGFAPIEADRPQIPLDWEEVLNRTALQVFSIATSVAIPGLDTEKPEKPNEASSLLKKEMDIYDEAILALSKLQDHMLSKSINGRNPLVTALMRRYIYAKSVERGDHQSGHFLFEPLSDPFGHSSPTGWFNTATSVPDQIHNLLAGLRNERDVLAGARQSLTFGSKRPGKGEGGGAPMGRPQNLMLKGWVSRMGELWLAFTSKNPTLTKPTGMKEDEEKIGGDFAQFVRLVVQTRDGGDDFLAKHARLNAEIDAVCTSYRKQFEKSAQKS